MHCGHIITLAFLASFSAFSSAQKDVSKVRFHLYYSKNFNNLFVDLDANNPSSLQTSKYNSNKPTKIICHGWLALSLFSFPQRTKNAYLSLSETYNVIVVNWDAYSEFEYNLSASYVPDVGRSVANLINALIAEGRATIDDFHFIGHSLGAHIGAFVTPNLSNGQILPRLTGLDPAKPGFQGPPDTRLDASDATFVDVIRSSTGFNFTEVTEPDAPVGTVDFYPNGGVHQNGCPDILPLDLVDDLCNHIRAYEYFTESITTKKGFKAYKCASFEDFKGACPKTNPVLMGEFVPETISGSYYLKTGAFPPYALG